MIHSSTSLLTVLAFLLGSVSSANAQSGVIHPAPDAGDHFRFVILADPQVGAESNKSPVSFNSQETTAQTAAEVNSMTPRPAFA
jgi:hypothetical protein